MTEQLEIIPISPLKRAFDVIVSIMVIAILSPLIFIILVIYLFEQMLSPSARGPFLYQEIRISQGKPFKFYKIRTFKQMCLSRAQTNGTIHTKELEQDLQNLTITGRFLRQIYLDEFPQLFLVLAGIMTLVGPRPTNIEEYAQGFASGVRSKAIMQAGLTGKFQAYKSEKYRLKQEEVDMEYATFVRNNPGWQVVLRDSLIILQTIIAIIRAEGI